MPSSKDKGCTCKTGGTHTCAQVFRTPAWTKQRASWGGAVKLAVFVLCLFLTEEQPQDLGDLVLSALPRVYSSVRLHPGPLLAVGLAYLWRVWIPGHTKRCLKARILFTAVCGSPREKLWEGGEDFKASLARTTKGTVSLSVAERRVCLSSAPVHKLS